MNHFDVIIIGAGVTGSSCARELSRYQLDICVLEKEADICCGTSKANSGIVHSGIDARPGSLMAELNMEGNRLMEDLCMELDVSFRRNGSLILCFSEEDRPALEALYQKGLTNQVPGLQILSAGEVQEIEPAVSKDVVAAILAPSGGIVCPFGLTAALAENAAVNGAVFHLNTRVLDISRSDEGYLLSTNRGSYTTKCIINAAGVYADQFHNMLSSTPIHITPRRGEYCLFDKSAGSLVSHTIFQLPGPYGKGVLITPTVHGNLMAGPNAIDHPDKDDTSTTAPGLSEVMSKAGKSVPTLPFPQIITSFAGNRAHEDHHDFLIGEVSDAPGFIDVAGIESPGLTAAPAIGQKVAAIVASLYHPKPRPGFTAKRTGILNPQSLSSDEYEALLLKTPSYGNIICRCEGISEGEILDAIHRPLGARTLDGLKRRVRVGSGRCQAGFCTPKAMDILARELGIPKTSVTKNGPGSELLASTAEQEDRL